MNTKLIDETTFDEEEWNGWYPDSAYPMEIVKQGSRYYAQPGPTSPSAIAVLTKQFSLKHGEEHLFQLRYKATVDAWYTLYFDQRTLASVELKKTSEATISVPFKLVESEGGPGSLRIQIQPPPDSRNDAVAIDTLYLAAVSR
ncbi:hypothetical protein [Pseudomonas sp. AN3A02]|uniref:hypothetical protein n=1 Tax=Pseudomonas sp. AN3A02 TaxID=2719587 RepID=UPI00142FFC51|nr:hypothetical protein [Pseudomonas sp. AN3A02]NIL18218.1 hypothetical protein [Pseudomonas sp. AN3A02]